MIWLARHGETAYNAERRFQGQGPVGLSDLGREQARDLAARAEDHAFASLWCSPSPRARETADIVAERIRLQPREDPRLMETHTGDWTDRTFADVESAEPGLFSAWADGDPGFAFPGGESFAEQRERVAAALADIRATGPLPALVVCHRHSMRLALEQAQGRSVALDELPNGALVAL